MILSFLRTVTNLLCYNIERHICTYFSVLVKKTRVIECGFITLMLQHVKSFRANGVLYINKLIVHKHEDETVS